MSDSGRQIGDCEHGMDSSRCPDCRNEKIKREEESMRVRPIVYNGPRFKARDRVKKDGFTGTTRYSFGDGKWNVAVDAGINDLWSEDDMVLIEPAFKAGDRVRHVCGIHATLQKVTDAEQPCLWQLVDEDGYDHRWREDSFTIVLGSPIPVNQNGYPFVNVRITNGPDAGKGFFVDIYDILAAFAMLNPAQIQAAKKVLRGGRADKPWEVDMSEAIDSLRRALEIEGKQ